MDGAHPEEFPRRTLLCRAQIRRSQSQSDLRRRPAQTGDHTGGRRRRGGCHQQRQNDSVDTTRDRPQGSHRDTGRSTHDQAGVRPHQQRAGGKGRVALREPEKRRRGKSPSARSENHGAAQSALPAVGSRCPFAAIRVSERDHGVCLRSRFPQTSRQKSLQNRRRDRGDLRRAQEYAGFARRHARRHGRQGRPYRRPERVGIHGQGTPVDGGLQISRCRKADPY